MGDDFGLGIRTRADYREVVSRTRVSLRAHGFSILSEMPAPPGTGAEAGRRHLFMAVWEKLISSGNLGGPGLDVGDHLPCNVVVFEEGDSVVVTYLDPTEGMEGWGEGVREAEAARRALRKATQQVLRWQEDGG